MSEGNYGNPGNEGSEGGSIHRMENPGRPPYWKRAHRDWVFWLGMVLMLSAIAIYVMSDDLSMLPRG